MKDINLKKFIDRENLPSRICELYAALLLLVQPLIVHDGYFDITRTKTDCFTYLTAAFLAVMCVLMLLRREKPHVDGRAAAFCVFAGALILSSLLPGAPAGAWLGSSNRSQGIMMNLLYAGACLVLCGCGHFGRTARTAMLTGFMTVSVIAVCNHLGWDIFGFIGRLRSTDRGRFLSTLGNVDFLSAYTVLMLPVCVSFALREKKVSRRILLWSLSTAGLWAAMAGHSESAVLGLLAGTVLLPVLLGDDADALRRFPLMIPGAVAAAELYSAAAHLFHAPLSELSRAALSPLPAVTAAAAGTALWLAVRGKSDEAVFRIRKRYCVVLALLLVTGCTFLVCANSVLRESIGGTLAKYTVIDDDWGSDRGKIWRSFLVMFREAPAIEKMIGGGAGCVMEWDRTYRIFTDAVTDAAHNEYLHYLLTNGILGLSGYVAFLVLTARRAMKSAAGRALLAGCVAYAVQAAVNIAQCVTTPLFFVLLFLCGSGDEASEEKKAGRILRILACLVLAAAVLASGAVNGAPKPVTDPAGHEVVFEESRLYTVTRTQLYLVPGGSVYGEVPARTALYVTGRTGEWAQVSWNGMTLYVRSIILAPAPELGIS